ncbi:hypothetical protein [Deinococcus wulumuqiensis]|uniref:Uncharacterized protein n=1 Tax=Deinococcus wulumuqiensis TaxID=980427 RepID=A0AAV4K7V9_9DEIO|nr:hypothetical protein [Deinococcus wulumuqiensis]QII19852.1 hypothetical protein G6R31_03080 [Deinococcus wulumuqiensis R12]GGI93585.1 hypothetical protein GCM10010914_30280 [Deinococcus wulumuqiensis]GGP31278.1 hypothetical protein GCM10008021_29290 [Deinococcus wulumuqiensis]
MPLSELLAYFRPLAAERRDLGSGPVLQTPGVNVLALNAAYVAQAPTEAAEAELHTFFTGHGAPPLVLSPYTWDGQDVGGLRVGEWRAGKTATEHIAVEQVSRLQLATWAAVLAESYEALDWAGLLAQHFAARLEGRRDFALLLAYAGHDPVGAGLWRAEGKGGAMHLWGTLDPAADAPLLNAAAQLAGGRVRVSLPDASPLHLPDAEVLTFTLLSGR